MMEAAAASGKPETCDWLLDAGCSWGAALVAAERAGHWHVFDHLLTRCCSCGVDEAYAALRSGHARFLDWLELRRPGVLKELPEFRIEKLLAAAAEGCDLATFQRIYDVWQQKSEGSSAAARAARSGLLEGGSGPAAQLQRAMLRRQRRLLLRDSQRELVLAAAAGSPTPDWCDKVEWLETQPGYQRGPSAAAAAAAARADGMERLAWLRQRGYEMHPKAFEPATFAAAGRQGNIDVVRHLLTELALYHLAQHAAEAAAEAGQLDFLRALHDLCQLSSDEGLAVAVHAARAGHQHVVAWAVEALGLDLAGCVEQQQELLAAAAESGSLELLDWVWACGGPQRQQQQQQQQLQARRSHRGLEGAVKGGCRAALEWMADHGFLEPQVVPEVPTPLYVLAARNGDRATLRWLRLRLPGDGQLPAGLQGHIAAAAGEFSHLIIGSLVRAAGATVELGLEGVGPGNPGVLGWLARNPVPLSSLSSGITSNVSDLEHQNSQQQD
ncbi:hypothetical protein PLESTF_001711700 [Pleodorina starrii]|nr:hypothetical protein PLESTM_000719000 [Pleodorina starrii]GLC75960.1 hypothetical protein PLESTF_001711700 [Pleodorina starrii]